MQVEIDAFPSFNLALHEASIALIRQVRVRHDGVAPISDLRLRVSLEPFGGSPRVFTRDRLDPGETWTLDDVQPSVAVERLLAQKERVRGRLVWALTSGAVVVTDGEAPIDLLAPNEWPGLEPIPYLLAAFVQPSDDAVQRLLLDASMRLQVNTGSPAIDGYQSGDRRRVLAQADAVYAAIQAAGIVYSNPPASFQSVGQKIRLAGQVLSTGLGTCLDLSVLVAACLEQSGLAPVIVLYAGHALPGLWLTPPGAETIGRGPAGVPGLDPWHDDAGALHSAVQLGDLFLFESTLMVARPAHPLRDAEAHVRSRLASTDARAPADVFLGAVDIVAARRAQVLPLPALDSDPNAQPVRVIAPGPLVLERDAATSSGLAADAALAARARQEGAGAPERAHPRIERWMRQLLDLSLRNRLLNLNPDSRQVIPIVAPELIHEPSPNATLAAALEDLLAAGSGFELRSYDGADVAPAGVSREAARERRARADLAAGRLTCPLPEAELDRRLLEVFRTARTDLEDGGSSTLYLAVGTLNWFEADVTDTPRRAPIVLWPVRLERQSARSRFQLVRSDEEPAFNETLLELLRLQFGLDLSAVTALPGDASGLDLDAIFTAVRKAIAPFTRWSVSGDVHLGLFRFAKFVMWRDLHAHKEALLQSPLVASLVGAARLPPPSDQVSPESLDRVLGPADLPLVLDADSSQAAIVASALASGASFAVQGPPGTGKSQTIANLIAAAIGAGKTVLFAAEKLAALTVVQSRLEKVGLGDFCLELHSSKSRKSVVIESLVASLSSARVKAPDWAGASAVLAENRAGLNDYVEALHDRRPIGLSVWEVASRLTELENAAAVVATTPRAPAAWSSLPDAELSAMEAAAIRLEDAAAPITPKGGAPAAHPLAGVGVTTWSSNLPVLARRHALELPVLAAAVEGAVLETQGLLGLDARPVTTAVARDLAFVLEGLSHRPPAFVLDDGAFRSAAPVLGEFERRHTANEERRTTLAARYSDAIYLPSTALDRLKARFRRFAGSTFAWLWLFFARRRVRALLTSGPLPLDAQVATDLELASTTGAETTALNELAERLALDHRVPREWLERATRSGAGLHGEVGLLGPLKDALARLAVAHGVTSDHFRPWTLDGSSALPTGKAPSLARALDAFAAAELALKTALELRNLPPELSDQHPSGVLRVAASILENLEDLRDQVAYRDAVSGAVSLGLGPLTAAFHDGSLPSDTKGGVLSGLQRSVFEAWLGATLDLDPRLAGFDGLRHHRRVQDFRQRDRAHLGLARTEIRARLEKRLPDMALASDAPTSELGLLLREAKKKTRQAPLRRLISQLPNVLPRLKPCLLMSPLSVAQYLPPGRTLFDLVIFDEASQICTHDAIGVLARGKQVIVVGDSKQLPPTSFFDTAIGDGDDAATDLVDASAEPLVTELESILDEVIASGLPERTLDWHYRSRDESLIAFSNHHYYQNRLHTFPGAERRNEVGVTGASFTAPTSGVVHRAIRTGFYDRGRTGTTRSEAEALVQSLTAALKSNPERLSYGVVTFSVHQQALIEDLLDAARRADPALDAHISAAVEPVFVKNLENVQGDERDVIYFSIGYGPDEKGRVLMNFGPLNKKGGERRLNVAITRARRRLEIVSLLRSDQIDLTRTAAIGVRHLKDFLRYAEEGPRSLAAGSDRSTAGTSGPLERDVLAELRRAGYDAVSEVGCGGYRVDIGVVDPDRPGRYLLGLELDGPAYRSAKTARDRDRLRQEVLENLGWRLHRIWSTDWRQSRRRERERLLAALSAAREGQPKPEAPPAETPAPNVAPALDLAPASPQGGGLMPLSAYVAADVESPAGASRDALLDPAMTVTITSQLQYVARVESPIHEELLFRRVAAAWGVERLTERVRQAIATPYERLVATGALIRRRPPVGDDESDPTAWIVWRQNQDPAAWDRARRTAPGDEPRDPEHLPAEELAAALTRRLSAHLSLAEPQLVRLALQDLGYGTRGRRLLERCEDVLDLLESQGKVRREGERVSVSDPV
ncbi:MAG: DUF3320 domain-containing protein [Myxococcales bacterium]|nr:DUF3320 domain-containing protein [Myxococcales bacterium]